MSDRNVITAPSDATPGRLKTGRISGRSSFSSSDTTPNSMNILPMAPVSTHIAIRYRHVFSSRSCAVFIMVFIICEIPIIEPM